MVLLVKLLLLLEEVVEEVVLEFLVALLKIPLVVVELMDKI